MPEKLGDKLLAWGPDLMEAGTLDQASKTSRLPFLAGHVALMPDAHVGIGATVGSVIPTSGAIVPAAVGVDIGCGMIAVETNRDASALPDNLDGLMPGIEQAIPAGLGKAHDVGNARAFAEFLDVHWPRFDLDRYGGPQKIGAQLGTLGSGNHFFEVCLDERDRVWVVLHSGSRGIGKKLAEDHIKQAKKLAAKWFIPLEDPDLAYFVQNEAAFSRYIHDMRWAQDYALANRDLMMDAALDVLNRAVPGTMEHRRINCHHNFTEQEHHHGRDLWITRKGAIRAREGDEGVIPGSMGTSSYIVRGKGNAASYQSCSHGAGRRMSRGDARRQFTVADLAQRMKGRTWNADHAKTLIDEIPDSYKDVDAVMAAQADLVEIEHTLHQVLNYKGT